MDKTDASKDGGTGAAKQSKKRFHRTSQWEEFEQIDGLTLYDVHRRPRRRKVETEMYVLKYFSPATQRDIDRSIFIHFSTLKKIATRTMRFSRF